MLEDYIKELNIKYDEKKVQEKLKEYKVTKDIKIRNEIIEICLPLLINFVNGSDRVTSIDKENMYSYACEGLIYAIEKYDSDFRLRFKSYMYYSVVFKIISGAAIESKIKPKNSYMDFIKTKSEVEKEECKTLEEDPRLLDKILNRMLERYLINDTGADNIRRSYSISNALPIEWATDEETYDDFDDIDRQQDSEIFAYKYLGEETAYLTKKEKDILKLRYGFNGNDYIKNEVNKMFNMSHNAVNSIESNALYKLRIRLKNRNY